MALSKVQLLNFKCFSDSGSIPLAPLTLIFGRNNSGKSSILQSLLLLRQTLDSPEFGARLNLRGPLYPAGSYADIVHQHETKQRITMQFVVEREGAPPGDLELEFSSSEPQPPRLTRLKVSSNRTEPLEFKTGRGAGGPYELYIGDQYIGRQEDGGFVFPVTRFFPLLGTPPPKPGRPSESRQKSRDFADHTLNTFVDTLSNLKMVGAFRRQPSRRYEYQGPIPERVDVSGEYVVNALIEDLSRRRRRRGELIQRVNRWLKVVGRVRLMKPRRISRSPHIFELRLKDTDSGRWANYADVGFGIGQALPVIVEGLRTPENGMFLVQEPEIHLHPDAQLRMADFLVSLVRTGRRVVAETHSEHLLLRVRRAVLKMSGSNSNVPRLRPEDVQLIYVDKRSDGTSIAEVLEMDDLSQITNWPAGFMEESTRERMSILGDIAKRAEVNA